MKKNRTITQTEQVLLDLLSYALFQNNIKIPSEVDWIEVWKEAVRQAVAPIAFSDLNLGVIPSELCKEIQKRRNHIIAGNLNANWSHIELHNMMSDAKIPYVILKGMASAYYYPDPILRTMGDVDFLVAENDLKRAGLLLEAKGYTSWKENHACHIVYESKSSRLEMHFEPSGIPNGKAGEKVRQYLNNTISSATEVQTAEGTIIIPSKFHHGLILLLHMSHHLTGEGIGLRHLCDWAVFVNSLTDEEFCELFEEKLKAIGLWHFAQVMTQISIKYLGGSVKEFAENEDNELVNMTITDIFDSGNFGRKSADRVYEGFLISNRGKNGIENTTLLKQMIHSVNEIIYNKWTISKRIPLLLPFGWLFYGGRYLLRVIIGKRPPIHPDRIAEGAASRKSIYRQFKLYDIENQ